MKKPNSCLKVFVSCLLMLLKISVVLSKGQTRIVGGTPASIDKAPFLVHILFDELFHCGGALVSDNFVVTAAHCFKDMQPSRYLIVGGTAERYGFGIRSNISKIMIPTAYNIKTIDMDVAVIKLSTPLLGPSIKPIDLCKKSWKDGDAVQIYGWGKTGENIRGITKQLNTVTVNAIDKETCKEKYLYRKTLTKSMFCAAAVGKDACSGDSGGPAIIDGELCGIISWGIGCGRSSSPGVYTNVLEVQDFITSAMKH